MSNPLHPKAGRVGIALILALAAVPSVAQAAPVDLATVGPFSVLAGSAATNSGPSVLSGDLGISPGTALTGFGAATINGATHNNDAVAAQAQSDLTVAYDTAAAQPVLPANDLTGQDLGGMVLSPGAYRYTSSAQLTGPLVLDAANDPNAQFVFTITSALTTAPGSSVQLVRGASPCNVFWQVGSSATLDTTTAFQGNLMAYASISLNNGASVQGRVLARNGQVSLINNVIDGSACVTSSSTPTPTSTTSGEPATGPVATDGGPTAGSGSPGASTPLGAEPPASGSTTKTKKGRASLRRTPRSPGAPGKACTAGFSGTVRGRQIKRVVFRLDGKRIANRTASPFRVFVRAIPGRHTITARVSFKDATRAKTMKMRYRACASALLTPRTGPAPFTG
jgi:hypothetical protein